MVQSWPLVSQAFVSGEVSTNAGGLIRWPVYALIPLGFLLLGLQAFSELIKRLAFLVGAGPDPALAVAEKKAEEKLLDDLRARHGESSVAQTTEARS